MPSLHITLAPPPPSSAGWKIKATFPEKFLVSHKYLAAPKSIVVCPSCPQGCITPSCLDLYFLLVNSANGNASISALRPIVFPFNLPLIIATIPVFAI